MIDLRRFQERHHLWSVENFGPTVGSGYRNLLGSMEELGELAHAHLKAEQGIRNHENHEANKKDAIADVIIFLADYCNTQGFDLEDILSETWENVLKRNWKKDPDHAHETTSSA